MPSYVFENISDPSGYGTELADLNNAGDYYGFYMTGPQPYGETGHSYLYHNGTYTTLDAPLASTPMFFGPYSSIYTEAVGINDLGQVAGNYVDKSGRDQAFIYSGGAYTVIDDPLATGVSNNNGQNGSGTSIWPQTINNLGQVTGAFFDANGQQRNFFYSNGTYTTIEDPNSSGPQYFRIALNNKGQVIGDYTDSTGTSFGFLYDNGIYTTIGSSGAGVTKINDAGEIIGSYAVFSNGNGDGFLYSNGTYTIIDPGHRPNTGVALTGLNNAGQVLGYTIDASMIYHYFLYSDGMYTPLDVPGSTWTGATAINDSGQIAGTYQDGQSHTYAYVYEGGNYYTFDPFGSNTIMVSGINNSGEVSGSYRGADGSYYPFLATPVYNGPAGSEGEVSFISGVTADGTVAPVSWSTWNVDNPATYSSTTSKLEKWGPATIGTGGVTVTYGFDPNSNWSLAEETALAAGLALWSAETNISFVQAQGSTPDFVFRLGTDKGANTSQTAGNGTQAQVGSTQAGAPGTQAYISIDTSVAGWGFDAPLSQVFSAYGGYALDTIVHEEGHMLGLEHGGPYNADDKLGSISSRQFSAYDSRQWSLMSYIDPWDPTVQYYNAYQALTGVSGTSWGTSADGTGVENRPTTPMTLDILAAQSIYGAPTSGPLSSGGQIFGFNTNISGLVGDFFNFNINANPVVTIWDGGPNNTLDVSGWSSESVINLNPGTFSSADGMTNNIGIAEGTQINTVILGNGTNTVILPSANANDTIVGGTGLDTVDVTYNFQSGYTLSGAPANFEMIGPAGIDTFKNVDYVQFADGTLKSAQDLLVEPPTLTITSAALQDNAAEVALEGSVDVADAGATISILDNGMVLTTLVADATGAWSATLPISAAGVHTLTAEATNPGGSSSSNEVVDLVNTSATVSGGGKTVLLANPGYIATLTATAGNWDTVVGSNGAIFLEGAQASVIGSANTAWFTSGTGNAVGLYNTISGNNIIGSSGSIYLNSAQASVIGGGDFVNFAGGTGNAASLSNSGGAWDMVTGSSGTVNLTSAQASVIGGGDTIAFTGGSGNAASLYNTVGSWDIVSGSNGSVTLTSAQASVIGGGDAIAFAGGSGNAASLYNTGGSWDTVTGSNGTVVLSGAQATVIGGGDYIAFLSTGDAASLYNTAGSWDYVTAANATVYLTAAQATVAGGGDYVDFLGTGDAVTLTGTAGSWDYVTAANATVYLTAAQATVAGGGDYVDFLGTGDAATLTGTAGSWDYVSAANATVYLNGAQGTVAGGGNWIDFLGTGDAATLTGTAGSWDYVNATNSTVYLNGAQSTVAGGGNWVDCLGTGDAVTLTGTAGSWDYVNASNSAVYLSGAQSMVAGGGDTLNLSGSGDAATLLGTAGSADSVNGSNGTLYFSNAQASVTGNSDTLNFSGTANTATVSGSSESFVFQPAFGVDTINGFASTDTMTFSASDFANWSALLAHTTQSGANTVIALNAADTITLTGVAVSSLQQSQFKFV